MSGIKHKVTVEIFGELYSLKSDIELEQVMKVAALVDERMKKISKSNLCLSPSRVAVLAALNLAEDFLQLEHNYKQLIKMVEEE
ncbi:cell division protein ZapA [Pelosinus sp. sgz500959]|uniref:cell division protein ZapA n=1 Tax=Pelosinus sp. sgz500959 TaxID=3242472 RepID=UPI00366D437F